MFKAYIRGAIVFLRLMMSCLKVTIKEIQRIVAAYDFLNSNGNNFHVSIWYNSTYKNDTVASSIALVRVPRSVNLVCVLKWF